MDIKAKKGNRWYRYLFMAYGCGPERIALKRKSGAQNNNGYLYMDSLQEARDLAINLIKGHKMGLDYVGEICMVRIGRHRSEAKFQTYEVIQEISWAPIATAKNEAEMKRKEYLRKPYLSSKWEWQGNKFVLLAHGKRR
jgi:hypothetical protein